MNKHSMIFIVLDTHNEFHSAVQRQCMLLSGWDRPPGDLLYERSVTTSDALVYKCFGAEEMHQLLRANSMQTDSVATGNYGGDKAEISRRHSSQTPIVMVGTG